MCAILSKILAKAGRTRVLVMRILVNGDDVKSRTKVNALHGWLWPAQASMS